MKDHLQQIIDQAKPIIPVMVIDSLEQALPMAQALKDGGINVFEVTLRTPCAMDAISLIKKSVPDCIVGAGTVINEDQFRQVTRAGVDFIVSPGLSRSLISTAQDMGIPFIPGVTTPSDIIKAVNAGFDTVKFFPAEQSGGVNMLKALSAPFPQVTFCPTGGIDMGNVRDYLSLPNVPCVGGSWILPKEATAQNDWITVTQLAHEASQL